MTPPDFPAGRYDPEPTPTADRRAELITEIERLPARVRLVVGDLTVDRLDTKYRNWTVRQIIHHLADSHVNAYVRFRLALTEEAPTIKPYDETRWAELPDATGLDVEVSLRLLEALHARWAALLRAMTDADWERTYVHPEYGKTFRLAEGLGLYAHHGRHHTGQIEWLRQQKGWGK